MLMRVDAVAPVLCFLSSRLSRLATVVDGVYVYGPHSSAVR